MKTTNFSFYALLTLLALASIFISWRQPLLNSHSYRQTETAQTSQIFLEEGWHPFLPKVHFLGRPGYLILEFPLYQSLVAGISAVSRLSIQKAGRLINCLAAILLAWGVAEALMILIKRSALTVSEDSHIREGMMVLVMSSPLVFAMSQWLSIELLASACSVWALVVFLKMSYSRHFPSFHASTGLFLLTLGSFAIKPNIIFTALPLFAVAAWQTDRRRWARLGAPGILAFIIGAAWYLYGTKTVRAYGSTLSPMDHVSHLTMGDKFFFSSEVLKRFLERFSLYVFGPGTIMLMLWAVMRTGASVVRDQFAQYRLWILSCLLSTFLYLFIFCGANYYHNYYQLPTILPIYLALGLLIPIVWRPVSFVLLLVAIAANLAISGMRLTHQDKDWVAAGTLFLQRELGVGNTTPDLLVVSNVGATTPILGFYLDRYATSRDLKTFTLKEWLSASDRVVVCDNQVGNDCISTLEAKGFANANKTTFGKLDIYLPLRHG